MEDCTLGLLPYTVSVRYLVAVVRKVTKTGSYYQEWGCCCNSPDQMVLQMELAYRESMEESGVLDQRSY